MPCLSTLCTISRHGLGPNACQRYCKSMAKVPVTKTVIRDGKPHVQTYWEEDDKSFTQPSLLAGLGVSLPPQQKKPASFPQDLELENQWRVLMGKNFDHPEAQAAIAAGLTFQAAECIKSLLPEWTSLTDHIYENNLDEQPRPKGGWKNPSGSPSDDQLRRWTVMNDLTPDVAVKWIDAGLDNPELAKGLIKSGISLERAKEWNDDAVATKGLRRANGLGIGGAYAEMQSSMTIDEARQWRKDFGRVGYDYLGYREIEFYEKGFGPAVAKRWNEACFDDVEVDQMIALRDMKWSPSTLKSALKVLPYRNQRLSGPAASQLITDTPLVGSPKLMLEWLPVARIKGHDGKFTPEIIESIHEVEKFKERAAKEYGISFQAESNYELQELLPAQRETLLDIMDSNDRFLNTSESSVKKIAELARFISSPGNLAVLEENGFIFTNPETNTPYDISFGSDEYGDFDARTADKHSRDKWMKELAFRLYSYSVRQQNQRDRWTEDGTIDPVKLKDILLADPKANDVRLDALLVANVAQPVASGWL